LILIIEREGVQNVLGEINNCGLKLIELINKLRLRKNVTPESRKAYVLAIRCSAQEVKQIVLQGT